ncbi:MAG: hypothetical protein ACM3ZQ_06945 [Bacillota bacterium]
MISPLQQLIAYGILAAAVFLIIKRSSSCCHGSGHKGQGGSCCQKSPDAQHQSR